MKFTRRPISWTRYKELLCTPFSMLRHMQYESLREVTLNGVCLDIGGGDVTDYRQYFKLNGKLETVNIDPDRKPTYIHDLNKPWPMDSDTYDSILSLNTFEHLYNDQFALREMVRVMKKGARFHIMMPFLYRVHGSPSDYHRHTIFWWNEFLTEIGIDADSIAVEQHSWDSVANALAIINFKIFSVNFRFLFLLVAFVREWSRKVRGLVLPVEIEENPVGYYITGIKA